MSPRFSRFAAAFACGVAAIAASPVLPLSLSTAANAQPAPAQSPLIDQFKATLQAYGTFRPHPRYGEVWQPADVPQGWKPYAPCNWVADARLGWFYDDKTDWGRIVHHYGRWTHEEGTGWMWVPGEEFSPGWVVWRTSDQWVGWAPMPPDADVKTISADAFNTDKHWTFMEAAKFSNGCQGGAGIVSAAPAVLAATKVVTQIRFVDGIFVFVLPPPLAINFVNVNIGIFAPWSPGFTGLWLWNWNWLMANVIVDIDVVITPAGGDCGPNQGPGHGPGHGPQAPVSKPITSDPPPPPPGGRRTGLDQPGSRLVGPPLLTPPAGRPFNPPYVTPPRPQDPGPGIGGHYPGQAGLRRALSRPRAGARRALSRPRARTSAGTSRAAGRSLAGICRAAGRDSAGTSPAAGRSLAGIILAAGRDSVGTSRDADRNSDRTVPPIGRSPASAGRGPLPPGGVGEAGAQGHGAPFRRPEGFGRAPPRRQWRPVDAALRSVDRAPRSSPASAPPGARGKGTQEPRQ